MDAAADQTRQAIAAATYAAGIALANLSGSTRLAVETLPSAARERLLVHAAVAYLFGHGLIKPAGPLVSGDEWLGGLDIAQPWLDEFEAAVREAVAAQRRIDATLHRR